MLLGCLTACGSAAPCPTCPEPACEPVAGGAEPVADEPAAEPAAEEPVTEAPEPDEGRVRVVRGTCRADAVPAAMRETLTDEEAELLAARVQGWMDSDYNPFGIAPRQGIAFAKSEDDIGSDPPHPTALLEQGVLACGVEARWLAAYVGAQLLMHGGPDGNGPITCDGNVCCYPALMEYDSAGGVVFARVGEGHWRLRAAYEAADNGTLGEDFVDAAYRTVHGHLTRLQNQTCRREPRE